MNTGPDHHATPPAAEAQPSRAQSGPVGALSVLLRLPRTVLVVLVRGYQRGLSPYLPPTCRYEPVCSQYAVQSLRRHGAIKGTLLAAWRILRCNPFSAGGIDPPPAPGMWRDPRPDRSRRARFPGT